MRYWFDTEFMEDGKTIELLSIGIVAQDGRTLYLEAAWAYHSRANAWVKANVISKLGADRNLVVSREKMQHALIEFVGEDPKPEFWAWYGAYDWVALCQIFGTMMDLPEGFPMYVRDVKQLCDMLGNSKLAEQPEHEKHHALNDALWTRDAWFHLMHAHDDALALSGARV